jgi:hypothetical protein
VKATHASAQVVELAVDVGRLDARSYELSLERGHHLHLVLRAAGVVDVPCGLLMTAGIPRSTSSPMLEVKSPSARTVMRTSLS